MLKRTLLAACAAGALAATGAAFAQPPPAASPPAAAANLTAQRFGEWGFDVAGARPATKPGDDFFDYANGVYVDKLVIPADKSSFGAFNALSDLSQRRVHAILEDAAKTAGAQPTASSEKIGAFYRAYMDEARVEKLGAKPLQPDLAAIRAQKSKRDAAVLMGKAGEGFQASLFAMNIDADAKNPDRYVFMLGQGGLGLPDRDYYLDAKFAEKLAKYEVFVAKMLQLGGWADPAGSAKAVVAFETKIAKGSWSRIERRDPVKTYNPVTVADLERTAPGFDWRALIDSAGVSKAPAIIAAETTAMTAEAKLFADTPLETIKAWQAFQLIRSAAPSLSSPFVDASFDFYGKTLSGQPENQVRWKRASNAVGRYMSEAVGEVYVARYFPPESKAKMLALVGDLQTAFRARIEKLDWMSPETKAQALGKLDGFTVKIGYPDKFIDYSALVIRNDDLYGDVQRANAFLWNRDRKRINQPVDHAEWGMPPQMVNAYYNPVFNEIVFPAAILQPPFFDPNGDMAVNYGAIGGVIGHEMTHGFDDQGRQFDAKGRLRDWWTAEDAKKFDARADRLGKQYDTYEPLPGAKVQGKLTMGENIGDQGGLTLALDAYRASLHGKPAPVIGGLTGDQRVFLGWAQVWREKNRDDALRQQVTVDPHSPGKFRVNGVVRNIDAWYDAFGVKPGDKLYTAPEDRAKIW
jgi:putative endopeptidase